MRGGASGSAEFSPTSPTAERLHQNGQEDAHRAAEIGQHRGQRRRNRRREVELQVGHGRVGALTRVDEEHIARQQRGHAHVDLGPVDDRQLHMVLQILADARQVDDDVDAMFGQFGCRTDAGEQQHLGRMQCPGADDHLFGGMCGLGLAVFDILDAGGTPLVDHDLGDMCAKRDSQFLAISDRIQEGRGRTDAVDLRRRHGIAAGRAILLAFTVVVPIGAVVSDFDRAFEERLGAHNVVRAVANAQLARRRRDTRIRRPRSLPA